MNKKGKDKNKIYVHAYMLVEKCVCLILKAGAEYNNKKNA